MKRTFIKTRLSIATMVVALTALFFVACSNDPINIGYVDEGRYEVGDGTSIFGFVTDSQGNRMAHNLTLRDEATMPFTLNATGRVSATNTVRITFDASVLSSTTTNLQNHTLFPADLVEFTNDGVLTLAANANQSAPINMTITSPEGQDFNTIGHYVIPLRITVTSGNLKIADRDETKLVFVRDITQLPIPNATRERPIVMISCYEANNVNPLNHLSFTLAAIERDPNGDPVLDAYGNFIDKLDEYGNLIDTGELFFNMVIIFSANVNFDEATGRPFVFFNENVQPKLDRFYHYYRPLQERGARIILSLLPNWDRAGLSNMTAEAARAFAQEVRAICDAFGLDGIMFDEEYMARAFVTNPAPGFLLPSQYNLARLMYEIWRAQPHRYNVLYLFADVTASPAWAGNQFNFTMPYIDGVQPGQFIHYVLHDYGRIADMPFDAEGNNIRIPGLPRERIAVRSQEWAIPRNPATTQAVQNNLRADRDVRGHYTHMIFSFDPLRTTGAAAWGTVQWPAMQRTARAFFGTGVIDSGVRYPVDWR